jgi:hypothetical protein
MYNLKPEGISLSSVISTGVCPVVCESVVPGNSTSAISELLVAVAMVLPLFKKTRITEAVFVPSGMHRNIEMREPSEPVVHPVSVESAPVVVV